MNFYPPVGAHSRELQKKWLAKEEKKTLMNLKSFKKKLEKKKALKEKTQKMLKRKSEQIKALKALKAAIKMQEQREKMDAVKPVSDQP